MQYRVPKFLEREAKIAFGMTFKKLAVLGGVGLILIILWYSVPRVVFVLSFLILGGAFVVGAFVKVGGQSVTDIAKFAFSFFATSRTYMWKKKEKAAPIKFVKKKRPEEGKEEVPLKIAPESRLTSLSSRIEMGSGSKQEE